MSWDTKSDILIWTPLTFVTKMTASLNLSVKVNLFHTETITFEQIFGQTDSLPAPLKYPCFIAVASSSMASENKANKANKANMKGLVLQY